MVFRGWDETCKASDPGFGFRYICYIDTSPLSAYNMPVRMNFPVSNGCEVPFGILKIYSFQYGLESKRRYLFRRECVVSG